MRTMVQAQPSLVYAPVEHEHARELERISDVLDANPAVLTLVYEALVAAGGRPDKGRGTMTADQVLRCLILKQMHDLPYRDLAFQLRDSRTTQTFCRFGVGDDLPDRSVLQRNIKSVSAQHLEAVNQVLVQHALERGIESERKVRVDCTVTETNIHAPTDSSLLFDCVRVLCRLGERARRLTDQHLPWTDHTRVAKRRDLSIEYARKTDSRPALYKSLIKITRKVVEGARRLAAALKQSPPQDFMDSLRAEQLVEEIEHFSELAEHVMYQAERRAVLGETVDAKSKIVSIFEPHTDIIKKDKRETCYGHKVCLSVGSSLVLDAVIEDGNPADSTLAVRMVSRIKELAGRVPNKIVFDGGFASRANLEQIKAAGVEHVVFTKGKGITREEMTPSVSIYRLMRRFRAGVESAISCLKRAYGLTRCAWRGAEGFASYVWASVIASNLLTMSRLMPAK
jgi:IS5 family transposase